MRWKEEGDRELGKGKEENRRGKEKHVRETNGRKWKGKKQQKEEICRRKG